MSIRHFLTPNLHFLHARRADALAHGVVVLEHDRDEQVEEEQRHGHDEHPEPAPGCGQRSQVLFLEGVFNDVHLYLEVFLIMCTHIRECFLMMCTI